MAQQGNPYKRSQWDSGITQRSQRNFARFDRAVRAREALRLKMAEQKKINKD